MTLFVVSDLMHSPHPTLSALPCVLPLHRLITPGVSYPLFPQTLPPQCASTEAGNGQVQDVQPRFGMSAPWFLFTQCPHSSRCWEDTAPPLGCPSEPWLIRGGKHCSAEGSLLWSERKGYKSHSSAGTNTMHKKGPGYADKMQISFSFMDDSLQGHACDFLCGLTRSMAVC